MKPKRERDQSSSPFAPPETQFISQSDDSDNLWEVLEILGERGPKRTGEYLVQWKGIDPSSGRPWEPSWTNKEGCTQDLIDDWKERKAKKTTTTSRTRTRSVTVEKDDKSKIKKRKLDNDDNDDGNYDENRNNRRSSIVSVELPTRNVKQKITTASTKETTKPPSKINTRTCTRGESITSSHTTTSNPSPDGKHVRFTRAQTRGSVQPQSIEPEVLPSEPSSSRSPSSRPSPPKTRLIKKKVVDLSILSDGEDATTNAGPGPSTSANRSKGSTSSRSSRKKIADEIFMPPPSKPSRKVRDEDVIGTDSEDNNESDDGDEKRNQEDNVDENADGNHSPNDDARSQKSNSENGSDPDNPSSSDPIRQFSTSPPSQKLAKTVEPSHIDSSQRSKSPEHEGEQDQIEPSSSNVKTWTRFERDGEEGERLVADDEDDVMQSIPDYKSESMEPDRQDEDLDDLASDDDDGVIEGAQNNEEPMTVETVPSAPKHRDIHIQTSPAPEIPHPDTLALANAQTQIAELQRKLETALQPKDHPDSASLAQAQSKITQLESDLAEARLSKPQSNSSESITETDIGKLQAEIARLTKSKKLLESDITFIQRQYSEASTKAVEAVRESQALSSKVEILQNQIKIGLKQRHLHFEKISKDREIETKKLEAQVKILLNQSRLTDDKVRERASGYIKLKKENEDLSEDLISRGEKMDILTKRVETLSERNEELVDQLETIRAMRMGVIPDGNGEDSDEDDDGSDSDSTDDELIRKARKAVRKNEGIRENDVFQTSTMNGPVSGYACLYRDESGECKVICETVEQLHEHAVDHHREQIRG